MTVISIGLCDRAARGAFRSAVGLAAIAPVLWPAELAAQGQPVQNGPMVPVAMWWVGAFVLGLAIAYGIMRNRNRTRAEKNLTEQATKQLYAEEDRKERQSGSV